MPDRVSIESKFRLMAHSLAADTLTHSVDAQARISLQLTVNNALLCLLTQHGRVMGPY